jgi:hypothetical protein
MQPLISRRVMQMSVQVTGLQAEIFPVDVILTRKLIRFKNISGSGSSDAGSLHDVFDYRLFILCCQWVAPIHSYPK